MAFTMSQALAGSRVAAAAPRRAAAKAAAPAALLSAHKQAR